MSTDFRKAQTIAMIRRLRGTRKPGRARIPRQQQPDAIRLWYYQQLKTVVDRTKVLIDRKVVPRLKYRTDALGDDIDGIEEEIFSTIVRPQDADQLASRVASRTSTHQKDELREQLIAGVGVDVLAAEPDLREVTEDFIAQNVALIRSIPARYLDEVERTIARGLHEGLRQEGIAKLLEERHGVALSTAKLIARDQVGKFHGELNRVRQNALGITAFFWRTAADNRVRETHEKLNGRRFEWSDLPAEGQPGEEINCRCYAEPDMSEITGEKQESERTSVQVPEDIEPDLEPRSAPVGFAAPLDGRELGAGVPTFADLREAEQPALNVVRVSELTGKVFAFENTRVGNVDRIQEAWAQGKELPPLKITVDDQGNLFVHDGRHRLIASIIEGKDRELLVEFENAPAGIDLSKNAVPVTAELKR